MLGSFSNGGLGFGVAFQLQDQFSGTAQEIERAMNRLEGSTEAMQQGVNDSLNRMTLGVGVLATGIATLAPFMKGIQLQAGFEAAEIGLTTLLGSAEKASAVFESIKQQAAATPFETADLLLANQAMISQGIEAERSMQLVMSLGDALSAMGKGGEDMRAMALNLQQIAANGDATAMDIRQFAMRGVNMMALVSDATGITVEKLEKMPITLEMIEAALNKASAEGGRYNGAMERMSQSVQGKLSTLSDNVSFSFASIGKAIEPVTHTLVDAFISLMEIVQRFASSDIGRFVFRLALVFGLLATALGLVLIISGGLRLATYQLANAFTGATRAALIETMATSGLAASLSAVATAAWAAISPMLPMIAAFVAVGVALYGVYKIFTESQQAFADMGEAGTGLQGFMQRLGGFIQLIREVWNTWNGLTFELSDATEDRLKELGIYEAALALATWVLRIKEFFTGLWQGISEAATMVWGVVQTVWGAIKAATDAVFDAIGIKIGKNLSDLEAWSSTGKIVGYVLVGVLAAIAVNLAIVAVNSLIAFAPMILAIGLAVAAAYLLYKAFEYIIKGVVWLWNVLKPLRDILVGLFMVQMKVGIAILTVLWTILKAVGTVVLDVIVFAFKAWWAVMSGVWSIIMKVAEVIWTWLQPAFVAIGEIINTYLVPAFNQIAEGFSAMFSEIGNTADYIYQKILGFVELLGQLWETVSKITGDIANAIGEGYNQAKGELYAGIDQVSADVQHTVGGGLDSMKNPAFTPAMSGVGVEAATFRGARAGNNQRTVASAVQGRQNDQPIISNLYIDSEQVAKAVNNRNSINDSRQ